MTNTLIALVDDDTDLADMLAEYLSAYGFEGVALGDGAALDRFLVRREPGLILLDMMLPREEILMHCKEGRKPRQGGWARVVSGLAPHRRQRGR
ncbi:MAG: response regulator [Halothiobacillus sp.]